MNSSTPRETSVDSVSELIMNLANDPCMDNVKTLVLSIIKLLDSEVVVSNFENFKLFNDGDGKLNANSSWFLNDPTLIDRVASYKVVHDNDLNIDFKLFGINKINKRIVSWVQSLTDNYEDEPFNKSFNIGIDFITTKDFDKLYIVLSKNSKIRVLELSGNILNKNDQLSPTYFEIFSKWEKISNFKNKESLHEELWESFDTSPINNKFYKEISTKFKSLRNHLSDNKIYGDKEAAIYANRLIGRIIFCWFLDKKGLIDKKYNYFDSIRYEDDNQYYREKLESLFFKVLNKPLKEREPTNLTNKIFEVDKFTPYLNGGLFEPKDSDYFSDSTLSFPTDFFDKLFEILNSYNFTTDESTSEYQQIAIDPEMLGNIFENLLRDIERNASTGAFYTPRDIVEYICKRSLKYYLKENLPKDDYIDYRLWQLIDAPDKEFLDQDHNWRRDWKPYKEKILSLLNDYKVLDPACGSGAFPMGMLQVLYGVYERLNTNLDSYNTKLLIVENNLFGVDIEPMAVEISRLRVWLSIIVESENKTIEPLPNLDFKFICANSLLSLEDDSDKITLTEIKDLEATLKQIRHEFFKTKSIKKKEDLVKKYKKATYRDSLFDESLRTKQLKSYQPFNSEVQSSFFDPDYMFGVESFDLVIGNPPYIKEPTNRSAFDGLRDSKYYMGKGDIWYIFNCIMIDYLKKGGLLSFIAQNNWVSNFGAKKLRKKIKEDTKIIELLDFGNYMVFESAKTQTMLMFFKKDNKNENYDFLYKKIINAKPKQLDKENILSIPVKPTENIYIETNQPFIKDQMSSDIFVFNDLKINNLLLKICDGENYYLTDKEIGQGIVFPQDKVDKKSAKNYKQFKKDQGVFSLSEKEIQELNLSDYEKTFIKPHYESKQITRWVSKESNKRWLIYLDNGLALHELDEIPNLKKHIDKFNILYVDGEGNEKKYLTSDNAPYGLHRKRNEELFIGEKIIALRKATTPSFTYVNFDSYVSQTFNIIKQERFSYKYLVALLNSELMKFWLRYNGKMQGSNFQVDKKPLMSIPIKKPNQIDLNQIEKLVNEIIDTKLITDDQSENINLLINKVYNLDENDISNLKIYIKK